LEIAFAEKLPQALIEGVILLFHVALTKVVFYESFKSPNYRLVGTHVWNVWSLALLGRIIANPFLFTERLCPASASGTMLTHV
jgi:hypothetical protein